MKIFLVSFLFLSNAFAHEGDHPAPGSVQAPKGGLILSIEKSHIEVVARGKDLKVYTYDQALKPTQASAYNIRAKAEFPRGKGEFEVMLKPQGSHLEASFDAKGVHRYTLVLKVREPNGNHDDTLKFTIEPRK